MKPSLLRRVVAEFIGTAFLVVAVVGSGIMAERLSGGNIALALLANAIATGVELVALILAFGAVSGAHFNPVVSFADALERGLSYSEASAYSLAQNQWRDCRNSDRAFDVWIEFDFLVAPRSQWASTGFQ